MTVGGAKLAKSTSLFNANDFENSKRGIEDSEVERSNRAAIDAMLGGDAPGSTSEI